MWLRVTWIVTIGTVAFLGWLWGPVLWQNYTALRFQNRCRVYTAPPHQIVYDGSAAAKGAATQQAVVSLSGAWGTSAFLKNTPLDDAAYRSWPSAVAFLHARRSRTGIERVVAVVVSPQLITSVSLPTPEPPPSLDFQAWRYSLGSLFRRSNQGAGYFLDLPPAEKIAAIGTRVFAGQPDPADQSHFTIAFETEKDGRGIIDGWLKDDDTVILEVRKKRE